MVGNPEDKSSCIEAQITSMSQFHFPQIDIFFSNYSNRATKYVYARKNVLNLHNTFRFPERSFNRAGKTVFRPK